MNNSDLVLERIFELERTKDVLEHFLNNIELYVGWWTRMNMTLSCQENSSKQLIKYYCSTRKEQIMTQWIDLRTSFAQYADKVFDSNLRLILLFSMLDRPAVFKTPFLISSKDRDSL